MFKRISGESNIFNLPKTASTVMTAGAAVKLSSGALVLAAAADAYSLGIVQRTVATTDGDYASTTPTPVDLFQDEAVYECDVTNAGASTGTLTTSMVGQYFKVDAAATPASASIDSNTATTTLGTGASWICVQYISASKGLFKQAAAVAL